MADRKMNARIQHKHDTEANWLKATNFIPLEGELIIYDGDENNTSPRFKVGDGETVVSFLPFTSANSEGSIVDGDFAYFEDIENTPEGSAPSLDADSLGGIPASSYMTSDEVEASYVKASIEKVVMGEMAMSVADKAKEAEHATEATHAVSADEAIHANESDRALETDNSLMLGSKEPKYYLQPRNLLDNSDFRNPVNQRGANSYTGGYSIDRWRTWASDTLAITGEGITVSGNLYQYLEPSTIKNAVHTFATMKSDGTVLVYTANPHSDFSSGADGLGLGRDTSSGAMSCMLQSGVYVWAALYEGEYTADNLPPYVSKGYAAEKAECQRYYWQSEMVYTSKTFYNTSYLMCNVKFPQKMRINKPTTTIVSQLGTPNMLARWDNSTDSGITAYVNDATLFKEGFNNIITSTAMTDNLVYSFYVIASADL